MKDLDCPLLYILTKTLLKAQSLSSMLFQPYLKHLQREYYRGGIHCKMNKTPAQKCTHTIQSWPCCIDIRVVHWPTLFCTLCCTDYALRSSWSFYSINEIKSCGMTIANSINTRPCSYTPVKIKLQSVFTSGDFIAHTRILSPVHIDLEGSFTAQLCQQLN